jgi:hypothetical protein
VSKLLFIGSDLNRVEFYFRQEKGHPGDEKLVLTVHGEVVWWTKPEQIKSIPRSVGVLCMVYADGREAEIPLNAHLAEHLKHLQMSSKAAKHFFVYRGLLKSTPLMWEFKSKFKKYAHLNGWAE